MVVFPDLAGEGLQFIRFFAHLDDGWRFVERFWGKNEVPRPFRPGVAYSTYTRQGIVHTASVRWRRSWETCCNVRLSLDVDTPSGLQFPGKGHKVRQSVLLDFVETMRARGTPTGVRTQYAALLKHDLFPPKIPSVLTTRQQMIAQVDEHSYLKVEFHRREDGWLIVVEPSWTLDWPEEPVAAGFFDEPIEIARGLVGRLPQSVLPAPEGE